MQTALFACACKGSSAATTKRRTLPLAITGFVITAVQNQSTCTVYRLAIAALMGACENKTTMADRGKPKLVGEIPVIPPEFR